MLSFLLNKYAANLMMQFVLQSFQLLSNKPILHLFSRLVPESSTSKKLLGVTIDNKLKFDKHVENICQKASRKLNAPARLVDYMDLSKRRILMNAFFNAQFNYYPTT